MTFAYCDTFIWSGPNSVTISGKHCINISASVENANPLSGKNSSASLFKGEGESAINSKRTAEERERGREDALLCSGNFVASSSSHRRILPSSARRGALKQMHVLVLIPALCISTHHPFGFLLENVGSFSQVALDFMACSRY